MDLFSRQGVTQPYLLEPASDWLGFTHESNEQEADINKQASAKQHGRQPTWI